MENNTISDTPSHSIRIYNPLTAARILNNTVINSGNRPIYFDGATVADVPIMVAHNHFDGPGSITFTGFTAIQWHENTGIIQTTKTHAYLRHVGSLVVAKDQYGTVIAEDEDFYECLQSTLDALASGGTVDFDGLDSFTGKASYTVEITKPVRLIGNGATIDCSPCDHDFLQVNYDSYATTTIALSADADIGDNTITVSDASGFAAGDFVKILDDYANTDGLKRGELVQIASIDGNDITLSGLLYNAYTTTRNACIRKISIMKGLEISGFNLIGPGAAANHRMCDAYCTENVKILNCTFSDWGIYAVAVTDCLDVIVDKNEGSGYAVAAHNATDNLIVQKNSFRYQKAFIIASGRSSTYGYGGFPRTVKILDNLVESVETSIHAAYPQASNSGPWIVRGNTFRDCKYGALYLLNCPAIISENVFDACIDAVWIVKNTIEGRVLILGNQFINTQPLGGSSPLSIYVAASNVDIFNNQIDATLAVAAGVASVNIKGNTWRSVPSVSRPISCAGTSGSHITDLTISDNEILSCASSYAIYANYCDRPRVRGNRVISSGIIEIDNCAYIELAEKASINAIGAGIRLYNPTILARILNNTVIGSASNPVYFDGASDAGVPIYVEHNHFSGGGSITYTGFTNTHWHFNVGITTGDGGWT